LNKVTKNISDYEIKNRKSLNVYRKKRGHAMRWELEKIKENDEKKRHECTNKNMKHP